MPLYVGKYAICAFLQNMRNMLRSHDRYKPVSLTTIAAADVWWLGDVTFRMLGLMIARSWV